MIWQQGKPPATAPGTGGGTLSADDKRVNKMLIQERDERTKALEDLHKAIIREGEDRAKALQDVQEVVKRQELALKQQEETIKKQQEEYSREVKRMQGSIDALSASLEFKSANSDASAIRPAAPDLQTRAMLTELQETVASQETKMEGYARILQHHADDLQHIFAFASGAAATTGGLGNESSLNSTQEKQVASASLPEKIEAKLKETLKEVSDLQSAQTDQLVSLRSLVVEMYMNLQLHAVKASRIALRCTDLSKEDRRLALESLDAKERLVQEDIKRITAKLEALAKDKSISANEVDLLGLRREMSVQQPGVASI